MLCEDSKNLKWRIWVLKKLFSVVALLIALLLSSGTAVPQNAQITAQSFATTTARAPNLNQTVVSSLSNLPETEMLIYANAQRILNELLPRIVPEKDVAAMRKAFADVKQNAGIDPAKIDYVAVAVRFRKPTADLNFQAPEFMVVARGDFSADSLIVLARMAAGGKLRDEKYEAKTLSLMTIDPIVKEAEKNPFLKSFSEMAIVPLNTNTIAAGTPAYLRAAIDAAEGKGRITSEALNSLLRDPGALISIAGSPWQSYGKSFGFLGTETNPRAARCESKLGDFYAALSMDATNFLLRGAINADNPDTAKIINNLVLGFLRQATDSIKDKSAQSVLQTLAISPQGDEVTLRADLPQQIVIDLVREQMKPKPATVAAPEKPPVKPAIKRRRVRRRA
jgi:hypothetical protein